MKNIKRFLMYWLWYRLYLRGNEFHHSLNLKRLDADHWNLILYLRTLAHEFDLNGTWRDTA